jgi:hypothetical protein
MLRTKTLRAWFSAFFILSTGVCRTEKERRMLSFFEMPLSHQV